MEPKYDSIQGGGGAKSSSSGGGGCPLSTTNVLLMCVNIVMLVLLIVALAVVVNNGSKMDATSQNVQQLLALVNPMSPNNAAATSYKYVVPNVPPRKLQLGRGTCWDFGTIGPLEHLYRVQGIAAGYLQPNQYVAFSEQAYGNQVISLCQQYNRKCMFPGDQVAYNSTEGGEATLLWLFRQQFAARILPNATCPYVDHANADPLDDLVCDGIDLALAQNPIRLTVNSMTTLYEVSAIKQALRSRGHALSVSVPIHTVAYYVPCSDPYYSSDKSCTTTDPSLKTPCPPTFHDQYCVKLSDAMYNMNAEFRRHSTPELESGHVMTLVGYNDEYTTEDGMTGGFIIRNTWKDGVYSWDEFKHMNARGSHSIPFFMQTISPDDELVICANPNNPRNWFKCGSNSTDASVSVQDCTGAQVPQQAAANYMPYILKCHDHADPKECNKDEAATYFFMSQTPYGDGLMQTVFLKRMPDGKASFVNLKPRPLDDYAMVFVPADPYYAHPRESDFCGYYFLPYDLIRETGAMFGGFFVNDYDVTFEASSYVANAASYPQFNYTLLRASQFTQTPLPPFDQPYANDLPTQAAGRGLSALLRPGRRL